MATLFGVELMSNRDDNRWDLGEGDKGYTPECDEAYESKYEEWEARDWPDWLIKNLSFPFTVTREEDEDDAYFGSGVAKAPFRLGHKMDVLELSEEDVDEGVIVKVREKEQVGYVPLCDVEVTPKTHPSFWPVREYVVWYANRC
jgi:hypothetical protein